MKVKSEIVRGKSISVGGRELVPVVRRTVGILHQATISEHQLDGRGGGFVHLHPVGFVEQAEGGESFTPIPDKTWQALKGILAAAIVVPALLSLATRLSRRK
jgi:hypothetical protein